jgi:hypothetical protein
MLCRAAHSLFWLLILVLVASGAEEPRFKEFRNGSAVISGPELTRSWGDWVFFPFVLVSPGDAVSGTIRTFVAGASDDPGFGNPGWPGFRPPKKYRPMSLRNNLALLSVPSSQRMKTIFKSAPGIKEEKALSGRGEPGTGGAYLPLPYSMEKLLAGGRLSRFRLERVSTSEFKFTLGPAEPREAEEPVSVVLLSPDGDNYWGITVCRGGDMLIEIDDPFSAPPSTQLPDLEPAKVVPAKDRPLD